MVAVPREDLTAIARPRFDRAIAPGGYQWHYLDGVSDDGAYGIVVIALVGSPFSPAYARARAADDRPLPLRFCAMNVALYGPGVARWALTERAIAPIHRSADALAIGGSVARWDRGDLLVELDERTSPFPSPVPGRVRGRVRLRPECDPAGRFALDARGEHAWIPWSPLASIEVELDEPELRFRGHGYHDVNHGDGPLDEAFTRWCWSRARTGPRSAVLTYDAVRRDGSEQSLAFRVDHRGTRRDLEGTELRELPGTLWRIPRRARVDRGHAPTIVKPLEDTPFYARALVRSRLGGEDTVVVHEELSADRLRAGWVRFLLGFRMGKA
jgi:carotenoid 1,2-hydratase